MEKLIVSSSPHLRSGASTQRIMLDVIIALCPALIASFVFFGPRALILVAVTVLSCVLSEYISRKVMKRDNTVPDLSCIVTGLLLAFNLPVSPESADGGVRRRGGHCRSQADVRRHWAELCEPGSDCPYYPHELLPGRHEQLDPGFWLAERHRCYHHCYPRWLCSNRAENSTSLTWICSLAAPAAAWAKPAHWH